MFNLKILRILIKFNVVLGYKSHWNPFYLWILLPSHNDIYRKKNLKNIYKPSHPVSLKLKFIKKIANRKSLTRYIIMTSKGILTAEECVQKKTGGLLLLGIS